MSIIISKLKRNFISSAYYPYIPYKPEPPPVPHEIAHYTPFQKWASTVFMNCKDIILKITIIAPIALEGVLFIKQCFDHRSWLQKKLSGLDAQKYKKIAIGIACIGAIATVCYFTLPVMIATSLVLLTATIAIKTYQDKAWIKKSFKKGIKWVKTAFVIRPNYPRYLEILRVTRNILVTITGLITLGFAATAIPFLISGNLVVQVTPHWMGINPAFERIITQPILILGAYFSMTFYSLIRSAESLCNKEFMKGIYFLITGLFGLVFPISLCAGINEFRWHHSAYGMLMALLPFTNAFKPLGWMLMLDSLTYVIAPVRMKFYDMSNILQEHLIKVIGSIIVAISMAFMRSTIFSKANEGQSQNITNIHK